MKHATLTAAILFAAIACVDPPEMTPRAPTPGVPHVTVTSFNVNLKQYTDPTTVEAVGATEADVVCLQEVNTGWREVLRSRWHETYPFMAFEGEASGGLAVLSKYPFRDLGVRSGFDGWHPAWHVVVDGPIGPLQILQVHLRPPYDRSAGVTSLLDVDQAHLKEIDGFSAECDGALPTIVLGDFNESVDGPAIRYLEDRGFVNALPAFRPGQETWRYERGLYGQTVGTLDHVLYDAARLTPLNAYVKYVGRSDHLPVTLLVEAIPGVGDAR